MPQHRGERHTRRLPFDLAVIDIINVIELRVAVSLGKVVVTILDEGSGAGGLTLRAAPPPIIFANSFATEGFSATDSTFMPRLASDSEFRT